MACLMAGMLGCGGGPPTLFSRPAALRRRASVVDSQSIKAPAAEKRGFDADKKIVGRKRHIVADTDGRLLMDSLTTANISEDQSTGMIEGMTAAEISRPKPRRRSR
jgi:hypothetical protein